MNPMTLPPDDVHPYPLPGHNHVTRQIMFPGDGCPACDAYWKAKVQESVNVLNPDAALTDADLAAKLEKLDPRADLAVLAWEDVETMGPLTEADRTVTVEIPASMAAHMDRHRVGGYSVQGGVLSSDSRPEVWPL
ncbi:hypothetical protein SALGADO_52 [Arthrobacter phage Salgado]|uniref:Uncharacterized protein n=2 Tax=Laroyevirus TaxID=1982086 RepID=A0A0U4INN7_9CAUD|nr:hypothetical protein KMD21_gp48 [Arthrobacter phage LiSara]YP_010082661.1 hypothetical protein KMD22_gp52 [Arthrobacter phage Salgado]ALY10218.1 hypothetical protein SALGADO_52 [Arthrobacter phage Salgado]ASR83632.1 hypothetical protein SEA_LISARA_48 [Arthrobacter phage LiSara]